MGGELKSTLFLTNGWSGTGWAQPGSGKGAWTKEEFESISLSTGGRSAAAERH